MVSRQGWDEGCRTQSKVWALWISRWSEGVTVRVSYRLDKMWGRGWREVMPKSCQRWDIKKEKPQAPYYVVLGAQLSRESRNRAARHQSCPLEQQANTEGVKPLVTAAGGRRLTRNAAPVLFSSWEGLLLEGQAGVHMSGSSHCWGRPDPEAPQLNKPGVEDSIRGKG